MKLQRALTIGLTCCLMNVGLAKTNVFGLNPTNYQASFPVRIAPPPPPRAVDTAAIARRQAAISNSVGRATAAPHIKAVPGGGRADFGLLKVFFPADVNGTRPVAVTTADGGTLAFRPRGLAWYDTSTGQRWWLAQITNRLGFIRGPEVIWTNAFDSVRADLRLRYSARGHRLEQDVILRQRPPLPGGLLMENARLEVWTEWFDSVPTARVAQTIDLRRGSGLTNLATAFVADEGLTFGTARVGAGFAFSTGTPGERTPVAKAWFRASNRDWLVETVDYPALKRKLDALAGGGTANATLPAASSEELIASLTAVRSGSSISAAARLAALSPHAETEFGAPGVVLDFAILSCVPVPPNAVSWWPAGGDANDVIGGQNGSLQNSATYGPGEIGQGFSFPPWNEETESGGDGYVRVPDSTALHFANALTIEAWIHPDDVDNYHEIVSTWDAVPNNNQKSYTTALAPGGDFYFGLNPTGQDGQDACVVSASTVEPGTWTHIAATYDGSVMRVYLNGDLEGEGVYTGGIFGGVNNVGIGACIGGAQNGEIVSPFIGQIDEPALYRRALSGAEIKAIYDAGTAGKINPNCISAPADLTAWLPGDAHPYDVEGDRVATLQNGATYAAAVAGHGFSFDGVDDGVTVANDAALNFGANEDFTLEAWIRAEENGMSSGVMSLVGKRYSPYCCIAVGYELFLLDGKLGLQLADVAGPVNFIDPENDLRDGGWHHVVASVDRDAEGHLYVDGAWVLEFDPTGSAEDLSNTDPLRIGVHPDSAFNGYFKGVVDEVSVYRRALTGPEISQLYQAGGAGKCKVDTDDDGMPDWWEMKYFGLLDRNGSGDYDSDGVTDKTEFLQGRNPLTGAVGDSAHLVNLSVFTPLR